MEIPASLGHSIVRMILSNHEKTKGRRTRGEEDGKQRAFQILSVPLWLVQMLGRQELIRRERVAIA
jgi:hypothetical protein